MGFGKSVVKFANAAGNVITKHKPITKSKLRSATKTKAFTFKGSVARGDPRKGFKNFKV